MSERDIFIAALQKEAPAERQAYLDEACAGQPGIAPAGGELAAALRRRRQLSGETRGRIGGYRGGFRMPPNKHRRREAPGAVIGPYKLLEQIGEGGMGTVWMAEQTEPVRRLVALKLIKAGMDSKQVIARFEAERQALALMDHPNIARVLDGGHDRRRPALFRHGARQGRADHRVLRRQPPDAAAAAGAVHPRLPGDPARAPEGHHPPRPQAVQRAGRAATTASRCPRSSTSASPRRPGRR